jgi:predicted Zn finger-like uncharacterized protein
MKVVCESCHAKYQVPDERVAGKKLKIRCKRCGATVLIRGDLVGADSDSVASEAGQTHSGAPESYERASIPHEAISLTEAERTSGADHLGRISSAGQLGQVGQLGQLGQIGDEDASDADYEWHVSLDGDTQGPFSTPALRDWLNATVGGWDAHVWREGFPDWLDARACAELGPAPAMPAIPSLQEDEVPTQTFSASSFEGAQFMADLAAPRAAQSVGARTRVSSDMIESAAPRAYSQREQSGFTATASYTSTMTGAASPARPAISGAGGAGGASYSPGPNPGFASGEASGLIDIRALASLARQSTTQIAKNADSAAPKPTSTAPKGNAPSQRPDTGGLSFGKDEDARVAMANQPTGFGRLDSLAPVSNTMGSNAALPLAILGGCALVAAAVLAAVLFNKGKPAADVAAAPPVVQEQQESSSAATAMPPAQKAAAPEDPQPPAAPPSEDEPAIAPANVEVEEGSDDELSKGKRQRASQGAAEGDKEPPPVEDKSKPKKDDKPVQQDSPEVMLAERAKPVKQAPPLTVTPLGAAEAPKAEAAKAVSPDSDPLATKPPVKPAAATNRSIDDLLNGASPDKPAAAANSPAPAAAAATAATTPAPGPDAADLPDTPSRDETLAAMRGVEAAVRACAATETITGTAEVAINVAGATGRVTSATVTGITGTVGSCIARAVRNARFPRFAKQTFTIKYPYRF